MKKLKKSSKILIKENLRKIKNNKKIFIANTILIAFAIAFYSTFSILEKNINTITKVNYDENNIMDLLLSSNIPFLYEDLDNLKNIKEIKSIEATKEVNAKVEIKNKELNVIVSNINKKSEDDNESYINKLDLTYGKLPKTINEGLVDTTFFKENNLALGDLITIILDDNNYLRAKKIKIVGTVKQKYKTNEKNYIYIPFNNFNYDYYNKVYITLKDTNKLNNKQYLKLTDEIKKSLYKNLGSTFENRKSEYIKELDEKIKNTKNILNNLYNSSTPQESINEQLSVYTSSLANLEELKKDSEKLNLTFQARNDVSNYQNIIKKITNYKNFILLYLTFVITVTFLNIFKIIFKDKKFIATLLINNYNKFKLSSKYVTFAFLSTTIGFIISIFLFNPLYSILLKFVFNIKKIPISIENAYFIRNYLLLLLIQILSLFTTLYYMFNNDPFILIKKLKPCKKV